MKARPRMTLAEMAAQSAGTGGRLVCPKCGCADFRANNTRRSGSSVYRYRNCRHCGASFVTSQSEERILRPVDDTAFTDVNEFGGEEIV